MGSEGREINRRKAMEGLEDQNKEFMLDLKMQCHPVEGREMT